MDQSMATPEFSTTGLIFGLAFATLFVAAMWRLYSKAGESGWKCLVPIYGAVVFQRILGRPTWWVLLMMIPVVNIVIALVECFDLARVFGKGAGYGLGLIFLSPLFVLLLAFGPATYVGPGGTPKRGAYKPVAGRLTATSKAVSKEPVRKRAA